MDTIAMWLPVMSAAVEWNRRLCALQAGAMQAFKAKHH
jgi:hypothetical protein